MVEEKLDDIIGEFCDGPLTKKEFKEIMETIRTNRDYLDTNTYKPLLRLARQEGTETLTKRQFVRCREYAIFAATGVTRAD